MKIGILTSTYNRPEMLEALVVSLACSHFGTGHEITHYILDDGSDPPVDASIEGRGMQDYDVLLFQQHPNQGREGYWATKHNLFELARDEGHDLIVHLDDDVTVSEHFIEDAVRLWADVRNPYAMLNLFLDERIFSHFRGKPPQIIDGMCLIPAKLLDLIGWTVYPQSPGGSSTGIWRQLSRRLVEAHPRAFVYYLNQSLTDHHGTTAELSKLNKKDREALPMETLWFADETEGDPNIVDPIRGMVQTLSDKPPWLLTVHEGIGNCIIPYFLYLAMLRENPNTDIYCKGPAKAFYVELACHYGTECLEEDVGFGKYGKVVHAQRNVHKEIVSDHGRYSALCDDMKLYADRRGCTYREVTPIDWPHVRENFAAWQYDVVICAGALDDNGKWLRKRYRRWPEVVATLKGMGYSVACIGSPNDFIYGAEDRIGLPLLESFDIIAACKCFMSNCTGPAHFAEAIGKDHVVALTSTDREKNWKAKYNRFARVVDLSCKKGTCQADPDRWRGCLTFDCCYSPYDPLIKEVLDVLNPRD